MNIKMAPGVCIRSLGFLACSGIFIGLAVICAHCKQNAFWIAFGARSSLVTECRNGDLALAK